MNFIFASKLTYTISFMPLEHFQTILKFFDDFDHIFYLTFRPLKVSMTPLGRKFELQIQIFDSQNTAEQKKWVGRSLGLHEWGLSRKMSRFFDFQHLMSHRGKGVPHIGNFCIPNNSLWFVLSFKPLNGVLAPPVVRKHIFFSKFPTSKCPNSRICHLLRGPTCMSVFSWTSTIRISQSHTWIISGIRPLPPWTVFQGVCT